MRKESLFITVFSLHSLTGTLSYLKELKFGLGEIIYEWARGMIRSFGP